MTVKGSIDDPYAFIADLYDLEHDGFDDDIALYLQSAMAVGDPILELGCGTGRILRSLKDAGYRVTGLDASSAMLERARQRLAAHPSLGTATLHLGEMAEADDAPGGPFGLILISLNGLLHLTTAGDQARTLAAARRSLDPRGQLIIDVFHPLPEILAEFDGRLLHEGSWRRADGSRVDKLTSRRHHAADQTIDTTIWYEVDRGEGVSARTRTSFVQRYLHASELSLLLAAGGFESWETYGSYDLEPFHDASDRIIVTAEAKRD